ncbi:hypothetical protein [Deinococcus hohokamensis]|uniref:DUF2268 domain-containing protein n=1 Tax=Deinococcus hohokamensis TaxID=309883 RepID=A0ABV9IFB7_9DEIO
MPELFDLTPRFQTFYALAQGEPPDERWVLWQEHYNFAAVPPVPAGQALARKLLDEAWARYVGLPANLSLEVSRLESQANLAAAQVEVLFQAPVPAYRLVTYVGGFEANAFVAGTSLCMPVEMSAEWAAPVLTHELTHLVHHQLSGSDGSWTRSLAALVVQEGLATRATQILHPEASLSDHIGDANWLRACDAQREMLGQDALPRLGQSDDGTLLRFIQPHPNCGLDRTAYALGWWLTGEWLSQGRTLAELARVPEANLPMLVASRLPA